MWKEHWNRCEFIPWRIMKNAIVPTGKRPCGESSQFPITSKEDHISTGERPCGERAFINIQCWRMKNPSPPVNDHGRQHIGSSFKSIHSNVSQGDLKIWEKEKQRNCQYWEIKRDSVKYDNMYGKNFMGKTKLWKSNYQL